MRTDIQYKNRSAGLRYAGMSGNIFKIVNRVLLGSWLGFAYNTAVTCGSNSTRGIYARGLEGTATRRRMSLKTALLRLSAAWGHLPAHDTTHCLTGELLPRMLYPISADIVPPACLGCISRTWGGEGMRGIHGAGPVLPVRYGQESWICCRNRPAGS